MPEKKQTFNKGDQVPESSHYVCVPCGFKKEYKAGEVFGECTSCLAGTDAGHEEFIEGLEMWEQYKDIEKTQK
ncbi:MAG: hypothetical protein WCV50_00640 [Patescibacteria group bacterium]|jgi:hypothetical protein